ncbi:uncharacterized protein LOC129721836 isoform X2 [Wyeomyia smithii]|uniref:uncharacterized protein LOC129721836 isoform X2 n=1 Tax=Wyeomyia smithii TaxID=174621 RepID=UPI00246822AB|nr:uncharacterized protein LOC129721836 isoform X2 [Wyeomyia smithii]
MGNAISSANESTLPRRQQQQQQQQYSENCGGKRFWYEQSGTSTTSRNNRQNQQQQQQHQNPESSRMLFLLYLIHRTWNVVVDTVDQKGRKSRAATSEDSGAPRSNYDDAFDTDANFTDLDDDSSLYGSQYSYCNCSYCEEQAERSHFDNARGNRFSFCDSDISYCSYQMAPSAGKNPPGGNQIGPPDVNEMTLGWNSNIKENQRPPVFNPEDYVISLKKYGRRGTNGNFKSIYDTSPGEEPKPDKQQQLIDANRSHTLPHKNSEYRSPIPAPPEMDSEMTLRQFGSVTDLLTKLRADLRASFPSFVQEFVSCPLDGVSLLLEVLRAVQLSQSMPMNGTTTMPAPGAMPRTNQSYQRRALLDELACLQCLSICCTRSPEAGARLGTTAIGLLPLAAAATGTGIRSRIVALQLLTIACDKSALCDGTQRSQQQGHTAVSEALSTLRLRCAEPVRFRLLVGMLNSGGGSGELQAVGMKFINTFLESAESVQVRLYLQAELFQAGLDPAQMCKIISSTSPWLERLRTEVKRWEAIRIDIEQLQCQARSAEQVRSRLVILERRVQILHEEKTVLTTMERRLQERCAELQREVLRLKGNQSHEASSSLDKRPVALPRQVPPQPKRNTSENDDEGISSSETGQSSTPEPPRVFPTKEGSGSNSHKFSISLNQDNACPSNDINNNDDDTNATIEDVIEELQNIVNDAEREISDQNEVLFHQMNNVNEKCMYSLEINAEHEIVPVNLLPHPPRKSRSLAHLISTPSDGDGSAYDLMLANSDTKIDFFEDEAKDKTPSKSFVDSSFYADETTPETVVRPDVIHTAADSQVHQRSRASTKDSNRAILNVIMDARDKESRMTRAQSLEREVSQKMPAQQFNGVFFMTDMNTAGKYPKPDITAALEAKKVTKNLDRLGAYGVDSMIDIVMTNEQRQAAIKAGQGFQKGRSNHQHSNGGTVTSNATPNGKNTNANNNFKLRSQTHYLGNGPLLRENSRSQTNLGSKVTDLPSGLY